MTKLVTIPWAMSTYPTIPEIIDRFASVQSLADAVGVPKVRVYRWRSRCSIPPEHDLLLMQAAEALGVNLSFAELARARAFHAGLHLQHRECDQVGQGERNGICHET